MSDDPELAAMSAVAGALEGLDAGGRARVLAWAAGRFEVAPEMRARQGFCGGEDEPHGTEGVYEQFVDLFDAAAPRSDAERALVAGFWLQVIGGAADFASQNANDNLKELGHGVGNITDALTRLQKRTPALVRQVTKSGKSRQARKRYKLTMAGVSAVERLLAAEADAE